MSQQRLARERTSPTSTRRAFLRHAAGVAAFSVVPRHVLGGRGNTAPSDKVQVAIIGTGGQGIVNMKQLFNEPDVRIASLEARFVAQFSALDGLVAQLNQTGNFLDQALGNLPGAIQGRR